MADTPKRKSLPEIGRTGLVQFSGYIHEEYLRELQGSRWAKNVREMTTNDPIVCAPFFAIDKFTRQVTWDIEAASDSNEDQERAEFIRGALFEDMQQPWRETISEIHSYLPWGFSLHEIVYKKRDGVNSKFNDGKVGWHKWPIRAQESKSRWWFGDHGEILGMYQIAAPSYKEVLIPMNKALLFRTSTHKNNPEGHSLCRAIFRPWYFKKNIENIEGIGVERDLAGLPVIYAPSHVLNAEDGSNDASIRDYLKTVITNIKNNEQAGLLLPSEVDPDSKVPMYKFELVSSGGTKQFDTRAIIQGYNLEITVTLLMDFLLMGHQKVGSFALASSKTEMFSYALGAFLDSDCEVVNRYAIPRLLALNGMPAENPPKLTHGDIESIDLMDIANFISTMSGAGYKLTNEQLAYLLKQGGLPVPDNPEEMRDQQPQDPTARGENPDDLTDDD